MIQQPRNETIKTQRATARLVWKQTFSKENTERFSRVQKFVDTEVMRYMGPYTPMRGGYLMKSPILGTKVGSGHIFYAAPYARYQYYGRLMVSSINGSAYARHGEKKVLTNKMLKYSTHKHSKAQRLWFEAMKQDKKETLIRGAQRLANKGVGI